MRLSLLLGLLAVALSGCAREGIRPILPYPRDARPVAVEEVREDADEDLTEETVSLADGEVGGDAR
jgi:hypothetical protein